MIEYLTNYADLLVNGPGLEVNGFATLMLALFVLAVVAEVGIAIHDRAGKTKQEEKVLLPQGTQEGIA